MNWWVKNKKNLNYPEHLPILLSTFTGCLVSLVGIHVSIESSATTIKIYVITAGMKKYKLIIKKKEHD